MDKFQDKKYLLIINIFMQLVFCFFNAFFNIYIYSFKKDINLVLASLLSFHIFILIFTFIFYFIANKKIISIMFKTSFFIAIFASLATLFLTPNRVWLIFLIQFIYALTATCYYIPSEISTMHKNNKSEMKGFLGLHTALSVFALVLSPFLSGAIIEFISYEVLFLIMIICSIICFIFSFKINLINDNIEKFPLKEFLKISHKESAVRAGYLGYSLSKFAFDGPINIILPIIIFLNTGTNFSVGIYSSLAALIGCIALYFYSKFSKNQIVSMWIFSILTAIVSILVLVSNSVVVFFVYYFVHSISKKLLTVDINANLFTIVNHTHLKQYVITQRITHSLYAKSAIILSIILCFVLYNSTQTLLGLTLFFVICSIIQLISTFFVTKSYSSLNKKTEFNISN